MKYIIKIQEWNEYLIGESPNGMWMRSGPKQNAIKFATKQDAEGAIQRSGRTDMVIEEIMEECNNGFQAK